MWRTFLLFLGVALLCLATLMIVHLDGANQRVAEARAQVERWVEQLHGQTTETGVYLRHPANQLPENDPWGTPLNVTYAQGGFAETLTVRSAGPDRVFHTQDDIVAKRAVVNLKGVGNGAKENIEEFTRKSARGLVKGAAEGIQETVQEALIQQKADRQKQP